MFDLEKADKPEEVEILDQDIGYIVLEVRQPTSKESFLYQSSRYERDGNVVKDKLPAIRRQYGKKVLSGFFFPIYDDNGKETDRRPISEDLTAGGKPIASDPNSSHYREDWKELIAKGKPDWLDIAAIRKFESCRVSNKKSNTEKITVEIADDEQPVKEEVEEIDVPLGSSSSDKKTPATSSGKKSAKKTTVTGGKKASV